MTTVFISYSWDSPAHKAWVKRLADRLIGGGVAVVIDQYDCRPGDNFLAFMEQVDAPSIDRVLVILTEAYKSKADSRQHGSGYEGQVISAELYEDGLSDKFIPILRGGDVKSSTPIFLKGRAGLDMREESGYEAALAELLKTLHGHSDKPPLSAPPDFGAQPPVETALPDLSSPLLAALREAVIAGSALPELDKASLDAIKAHPPQTLEEYRLARVAEWSQPRYALDRRFTRLSLLVDQGPEAREARWQAQPKRFDDLRDVLAAADAPALVLLGPPGSGKSTLLRRLELDLAVDALRGPEEKGSLSLFVPLSRYRAAQQDLPPPSPCEWLAQEWALRNREGRLPPLAERLRGGRFVLLLDALNEMPHADADGYRRLIERWRVYLAELAAAFPQVRAVFSCRSLDYSATLSTPELPVPHVRIERLDDGQMEEFLTLYNPGQGPALWRRLQGTAQLDLFRSPFYLKLLLAQADADGTALKGRAALFTGCARQALAREVEAGNPLFQPGALLSRWDHGRLVRRETFQGHELAEDSPLITALSGFAHALQRRGCQAAEARVRLKRPEALALLGGERGEAILDGGIALQVLDIDGNEVLFVHQLFQEYFAARAVAARPEPGLAQTAWQAERIKPSLAAVLQSLADSDPLPAAPATGWEETFLLAAEMLAEPDGFLGKLATLNLPLAGRCAAAVAVAPTLRLRLQAELLARSREPRADIRSRIAAAHALAELGDPRFARIQGPHGEYLKPPLVAIPGGVYAIGSDGKLYADEAPACTVKLEGFSLGQFPVSNAEWRCFQDAGGYEDGRWWDTDEAKAWREGVGTAEGPKQSLRETRQQLLDDPGQIQALLGQQRITSQQAEAWESVRLASDEEFEAMLEKAYPPGRQTRPGYWDDPAFNAQAQPVVGVCWHEARAYCAWLSAQTGLSYRLPTEVEWEAAACGLPRRAWLGLGRPKPRLYPWGGRFEPGRCNSFESHLRRTTPVGVFPGGDNPAGLADLAGNVFEWTGSLHQPYPYDSQDGRENLESMDGRRVARGGSWSNDQGLARAAYRDLSSPGARDFNLGFRVLCVAPIP